MKFLILGAGSLGSIYGGMLDIAGHDVTLVARGENFNVLKNDGLTIRTAEGEIKRQIKVVSAPNQVDAVDVAFLTVKSRDTDGILKASAHLFGKTSFISMQNAAEKDEILARYVGLPHVIGGVSTIGATLVQPGVVDYTETAYNWLGELPNGKSERVKAIVDILNEAGIPTDHAANITGIKWAKLMGYCANSGLASLTRLRVNDALQDPFLAKTLIMLVKEGGNLMRASGVTPEDHAHLFPIKRIMESPEAELIQELVNQTKESRETNVTPSMLQDVLNNKPIEVEETFGYVTRIAKERGVSVPTFEIFYSLLRGLNRHILNSYD